MKKKLLFLASFALCILFSNNAFAQHNVCTADDYSLVATVDDGFSIKSDGGGSYKTAKSKRENVEVMFQNCSFKDFTMNLNFSARHLKVLLPTKPVNAPTNELQAKFYNFDRVSSVPVTQDYMGKDALGNPTLINVFNNLAAFCGKNLDGSIKLKTPNTATADNYAGCGQDIDGMYYVRRNVGSGLNYNYNLRFQNSNLDGTGTLAAGTSYIRVYHPDPFTWTLMPVEEPTPGVDSSGNTFNPCFGVTQCGALIYTNKRGDKSVESYPSMPFIIRLTSANAYDYQY